MHARLRGTNNLLIIQQTIADFPCLAHEIAEPRPDMNIKVTAFTESKTSYNTIKWNVKKALYCRTNFIQHLRHFKEPFHKVRQWTI